MRQNRTELAAHFVNLRPNGLAEILGRASRNFTIVYSPADDRSGVDEMPRIMRAAPGIRSIATSQAGHAVGWIENLWAYRTEIERFMGDCDSGGAGQVLDLLGGES